MSAFFRDWRALPSAPAPGTRLYVADIPDPGAKGFRFGEGTAIFSMIVVRKAGRHFAYLNLCPHFQLSLDGRDGSGSFLSSDRRHIRCAHHVGLFEIETGYCVDGPPEGECLIPIELVGEGDELLIAANVAG